jgi:hypothetical protein
MVSLKEVHAYRMVDCQLQRLSVAHQKNAGVADVGCDKRPLAICRR